LEFADFGLTIALGDRPQVKADCLRLMVLLRLDLEMVLGVVVAVLMRRLVSTSI
jgi:hypothetical protein